MDKKIMGKNIRRYREDRKMTIEQLAEKTGLSDNFIGNIERGTDVPSLKSIIKISNALCASLDSILGTNLDVNVSYSLNIQDYTMKEIADRLDKMNNGQLTAVLECIDAFINYGKEQ